MTTRARGTFLDYEKLINLATDMGYRLLETGAEIYRVEEAVQRILCAYGLTSGEVFAIPNCIIVGMVTPQGRTFTRIRRMQSTGTNIDQLERYNGLCRRICFETPPLEEAEALMDALAANKREYPPHIRAIAYFSGAALFCLFFGGSPADALASGLCGLAMWVCLTFFVRLGTNRFFKTVAGGAVSALMALGLTKAGLGQSVDLVTIGALMLLVPGLIFTNAMRDIMAGDMMTGISKLAEALLVGAAIALGTGSALWLAQLLLGGRLG
jgi:uncharacterized membrane protein YjjP (DUF1212 family)